MFHLVTGKVLDPIFQLAVVKEAVDECEDKELQLNMARISKALTENDQMSVDISFEDYIFKPIGRARQLQDGYKSRQRSTVKGMGRNRDKRNYRRPGLMSSDEISV